MGLLRRNRDFRLLYLAQLVSYLGDWFATVALIGLILDETGSEFLAAAVFVAQVLPGLFATPLAGPAADRYDRRRLVMVISAAQVVAACGFLLAGTLGVGLGLAAQAAISFLAAFVAPAVGAAVPHLVDVDDLPTANALQSSTWGTMLAAGAGLGGLFTAAFGRDAAFAANVASFALAGLLIAGIRRPMARVEVPPDARPRERARPIRELGAAMHHVRDDPRLSRLIMAKFGLGLAAGVAGLLAVIATDGFGTGDGGIGVLLAARGLGAFLGPMAAAPVMRRGLRSIMPVCSVCAMVFAIGYGLVPVAGSIGVAVVFVALAHFGGGANWVMSTYGLQVTADDQYLGRVLSLDFALASATLSVSFLSAGVLGAAFDPEVGVLVLASVAAVWAVIYWFWSRPLWGSQPGNQPVIQPGEPVIQSGDGV
jgi:Na+/melibiose symporter-like transporter